MRYIHLFFSFFFIFLGNNLLAYQVTFINATNRQLSMQQFYLGRTSTFNLNPNEVTTREGFSEPVSFQAAIYGVYGSESDVVGVGHTKDSIVSPIFIRIVLVSDGKLSMQAMATAVIAQSALVTPMRTPDVVIPGR